MDADAQTVFNLNWKKPCRYHEALAPLRVGLIPAKQELLQNVFEAGDSAITLKVCGNTSLVVMISPFKVADQFPVFSVLTKKADALKCAGTTIVWKLFTAPRPQLSLGGERNKFSTFYFRSSLFWLHPRTPPSFLLCCLLKEHWKQMPEMVITLLRPFAVYCVNS